MSYILKHHGKDEEFKAMRSELLNNTVSAQVNQRKGNKSADLDDFNLEHAQELFDKQIEKYTDEHNIAVENKKALQEQYKVIVQDVKEYLSPETSDLRKKQIANDSLRADLEKFLLDAQIPDAKAKAEDIVQYYSDEGPLYGEEYDKSMRRFNRWLDEFPLVKQLLDMLSGAGGEVVSSLLTRKPLPQKTFTINISK